MDTLSSEQQIRVIFDTDIGTDVDDCLALALLLGSPEINIEGITTVYGDVGLRARMCRKLLDLHGDAATPVYEGVSKPLVGIDPIYWPGHEGVGLLGPDDDYRAGPTTHAVDYLIETVRANPGGMHLLAVGPLTNVAAAMTRDPSFAGNLKHLTIMGGLIQTSRYGWGVAEHNITCDPESARIVLTSGAAMSLAPLDVTLQTVIRESGVEQIRAKGSLYHAAVADQVARYPPFRERGGSTFLHDPLAAATMLKPELFTWEDFDVDVELAGRLTRGMTVAKMPRGEGTATIRVATGVDVPGAEAFCLERIAGVEATRR